MSESIVVSDFVLRQAVKQFRLMYPTYAKDYAAQIGTARRIVRAGGVFIGDTPNTYFVGTLSKKNVLLVQNKKCACGDSVCCHLIAVWLAKVGQGLVSEQVIAANEQAAILHEEQDPHDDCHAEHGRWKTPRQHLCCDLTVTAVPSGEIDEWIACPHCQQAYCVQCDEACGAMTKRHAKLPIAPPAEREKSLKKFHRMTQEEYKHLLAVVWKIVPRAMCDPADALSHGLLVALQKYDGRGDLQPFIVRCAWYYALQQQKKKRRDWEFTDLMAGATTEDELEENLMELRFDMLEVLDDPRYVEAIDEAFIKRVEQAIVDNSPKVKGYPDVATTERARQILETFRESANLGKGIGVDEYEDGPYTVHHGFIPTSKLHNHVLVRHQINQHLRETFGTSRSRIHSALTNLRVATCQAINEGWLP